MTKGGKEWGGGLNRDMEKGLCTARKSALTYREKRGTALWKERKEWGGGKGEMKGK